MFLEQPVQVADLGCSTYQLFAKAVVLTEVLRQDRQDREQVRFQELLLHLRDGEVSVADWKLLMAQCHSSVASAAFGARVMLTSNLWTGAGLVMGAMGTVQAICYQSGGPPSLPVAVMVKFDKYWGLTLHDGSVPQ